MIVFGCSITEPDAYRRYAEPGIRLAAEPDSAVYVFAAVGAIGRSCNLLLDAAAAHDDLEALVIVHPHARIADPDLCAKLRRALSDPKVAVVGCAGATDVRSIAWWKGPVIAPSVTHHYDDHGGGEVPAFSWGHIDAPPGEVEAVDGFLLALSPWAVRTLRFDEALSLGYGYDVDLCLQARAAGRTVVVADLIAVQHRSLELVADVDLWAEAHKQMAAKWDGLLPGVEPDRRSWEERARRAEAEREAARAIAYSRMLESDARVLALERALAETTGTVSWRATAPLRRLKRWRAGAWHRLRRPRPAV